MLYGYLQYLLLQIQQITSIKPNKLYKNSMIIQPTHHHTQQKQSQQDQNILSIFDIMLQSSADMLNDKTKKETQRLRRYYQQKVYLSYCDDPSQYLLHMLHKSQTQNGDHVAQLIMGRQNKVVNAIKNDKYQLRVNSQGDKLKKIKDQLSSKINEMKINLSNLEISSKKQDKTEQSYNGYMEFRKKGYWNQQSEQTKKVRHFLSKMKKQKKIMDKEHEKQIQKSQQQIQQQIQKQRKQKQQQQKKFIQEMNKRREKIKSQRKNKVQQHKKRIDEANIFLQKYKGQKPVYILNEEKFKKQVLKPMEQQKKRKLLQIKKNRKPIDAEQLQLHEQRYQQFKQKLVQVYEKRQQDNQLYQRNMQKLKQLFHSHFHQNIEQQMNHYNDILQQKRKIRQRINSYSTGVKQQFKPKIDQKKKVQLQSMVKLLELKSLEKGKRKIKKEDGSIVYEEISPDQHKKLGVSYLEHLRKFNEGKKRKEPQDRSASMLQLSKKKIVYPDYLQQMRSRSRVETATVKSRNGWRKVISQQGYSNRDKYNSVMDHVSLLEHQAKQKQLQLKYMKNGTRALQLKQKLDQYYLESVAAKMQVLKDVILKQ